MTLDEAQDAIAKIIGQYEKDSGRQVEAIDFVFLDVTTFEEKLLSGNVEIKLKPLPARRIWK